MSKQKEMHPADIQPTTEAPRRRRTSTISGGRGPRGRMPGGQKPQGAGKTFARILGMVFKHYSVQFSIVVCCIILTVFSSIRGTWFMKTLIDGFITPLLAQTTPDYGPLLIAIRNMAIIYGIGIVASYVQGLLMAFITQGTLRNIRDELFEHMEKLPIKYFDTHAHGDIMSIYTNDTDAFRQMISQSLIQIINSVITIVSIFASMIVLSWQLTLLTIVMIGVVMFVTKYVAGFSGRYFKKQQDDLGAMNGFIEEMMEGQKVVKVFNHEKKCLEEFDELNAELFDAAYKANAYGSAMGPINNQLGHLSYVLCAIAGGALAISGIGNLTLGSLAAFLTFNKNFNMPVSQVAQQLNSIVMAMAAAQRVFALLDENIEVDEGYVSLVYATEENGQIVESEERTGRWAWKHVHQADQSVTYVPLCGDVVFDDVDFGYNEEKMVLHNIDIHALPGQKIAFVGSTGAGKTTITNLINRFYDIQDGKIRYDGININKIKKDDLRKSLGIVLQETNLFTATVMENIRFGKLDATDEEVIAAAKLANADSFIRQLPEGYNTVLKGNGASLSQGQRQLLSIARAAVADPPVLILDEATSSIDTRTERIVQDGMDKLMHGRTTFVIAHRLSTVKNSDCIMVLENGRIIERGNHDELISKKGRYYQLYTGNGITE